MPNPIKFGILGPGRIATKFCESLQTLPGDAEVYAVASRDAMKAASFAAQLGAGRSYGSYEALATDPFVDVVYIATPHTFHYEHARLCLQHGKAVLCEKPMTVSHAQTAALIELARTKNIFLMEAMWTAFIPAVVQAKAWIEAGEIGTLKFMRSDFGFLAPNNPQHRAYNLSLGGGAQLDVGIYPLFMALWLLGKPNHISAFAELAPTGADQSTSVLLGFPSGATASIYASFVADSPKEAVLVGTQGTITLHAAAHKSKKVTLQRIGAAPISKEMPYESHGLQFEAAEVINCLRQKRTESASMPWALSLLLAQTADEIKRQIGVRYAGEEL